MKKYTIEDIRQALIPIIGEGEATEKILSSFDTELKMPRFSNDAKIPNNYIVADSRGFLYRVIHISEQGHYKCKGCYGNLVVDHEPADIRLATHAERAQYYKNQVEFLRTNIAPFLNYFHMRQLFNQLKDIDSKEDMADELDKIETSCFSKLQDIKKLW